MIQLYAQFWFFMKGYETTLLHHILRMIFQENYFSWDILLTDQISQFDCFYFLRYWPICILSLLYYFFPVCDVINFEINLKLCYQVVFLHNQNVRTKMSISQEQKGLLTWKKKTFFFNFKKLGASPILISSKNIECLSPRVRY